MQWPTAGFTGDLPLMGGALGAIHNSSQGMPGAINDLMADVLNSSMHVEEANSPEIADVRDEEPSKFQESWISSIQPWYWTVAASLVVTLTATLVLWDSEPRIIQSQPIDVAASAASNGAGRIELPVRPEVSGPATSSEPEIIESLADNPDQTTLDIVEKPSSIETDSLPGAIAVSVPSQPSVELPSDATPIVGEVLVQENNTVAPPNDLEEPIPSSGGETVELSKGSDFAGHLLQLPPQNYAVQLLASHSEVKLKDFIAMLDIDRVSGYFETRYKEKPWFVAVIGNFGDRQDASRAIAELPENLRSSEPWVRSVADIQADILQLMSSSLVTVK